MSDTTTIELVVEIEREGREPLKTVELRKPKAGELRGLSFAKILELDFDSMATLLPRISDLTTREIANLDAENFAPLFMGVASFFVNTDG